MLAYKQQNQTKALLVFFGKQPGIMLSTAYLLLTLSGIFYSSVFYSKFDIAILKLADISDLLIAGISDPVAIVMFCGGVAIAVFADWFFGFSYRGYHKWKEKPPSLKRKLMMTLLYTPKTQIGVILGILITFVMYSFLFVSAFAEWRSEQIKSSKGELVYLKTEQSKPTDKAVFLLGSTTNFVITYDSQAETATLTPIENIEQIIPAKAIPAVSTNVTSETQDKALLEFTSSAALVKGLPDSAWRKLSPDNTIVMTLATGDVVIELATDFAPKHVTNIKTLVREKYFDGNLIIRSQDNYVAQWGDAAELNSSSEEVEFKSIGSAAEKISLELFREPSEVPFTKIDSRDAYANEVGFTRGLPTANKGQGAYLTHCYGMVGVARDNASNSGNGTGLYAVTGHSPRHLDLNVTLIGKVWIGMEHLSSLPRGKGALGFYTSTDKPTPIQSVRYLKPSRHIEVMHTNTPEFLRFVELRTTRNEEWFIEPTGKIELCNVSVPVRES